MADILHRIGAVAPLDDVYRAIATPEGIAGWWTTDTTGKSEVGGTLAFRFGDVGGFDMEILELDPAGRVRWRVTEGPEEWIGTEIDWSLSRREDYTIVLFRHEGWREPVEFKMSSFVDTPGFSRGRKRSSRGSGVGRADSPAGRIGVHQRRR
nr:SRPBCC domain-containing protein [Streptomyces chartreusis]